MFAGKVAVVTGGGTGIGRAIATELATLGATVVIASRNQAVCQQTALEINATLDPSMGRVVAGPATNVRIEDEIKALVSFVLEEFGAIHFLVNNAGGQYISPSEHISKKGFLAVLDTNLLGSFLLCRQVYNQCWAQHPELNGSIVNISIGLRNGMPYMMHSAGTSVESIHLRL
jgi:NAD(P)-dependent dehydrogenase (short-subunit alcohol dehydrogenase family)